MAHACTVLLDESKPDPEVRESIFAQIPKPVLAQALDDVRSLVRPPQDVFYRELQARYRRVRRFLPALLTDIRFGASPAGKAVVEALDYLRTVEKAPKEEPAAPLTVVSKAWQRHVVKDNGQVDRRAYTFCTLDELRTALHRGSVPTKVRNAT